MLYHPIIYVRGFAATQGEIEDTVADPYMGFNIGSTKVRQAWTGDVKRFYFESPLVRLMSDYKYEDVFVDGDDLVAAEQTEHSIPGRVIVIYRYYDEASKDFGEGKTPPIEHFAKGHLWIGGCFLKAGCGQAKKASIRLAQPEMMEAQRGQRAFFSGPFGSFCPLVCLFGCLCPA